MYRDDNAYDGGNDDSDDVSSSKLSLTFTLHGFDIDTTLLKTFECGDYIDVCGPKSVSIGYRFWYPAKIVDINILHSRRYGRNKMKCITIEYQGWDSTHIETIELITSIFCDCPGRCKNNKHRIAAVSSQSGFDNILQYQIPIDYKLTRTYDMTNLNNCTLTIDDINTDISIDEIYQLIGNILNIKNKDDIVIEVYDACGLKRLFKSLGSLDYMSIGCQNIDESMTHHIMSMNKNNDSNDYDNNNNNSAIMAGTNENNNNNNDDKNAFSRCKNETKRQLSLTSNQRRRKENRKYRWLPEDVMSKYDVDKFFYLSEWKMKQLLFRNEFDKLPLTMAIESLNYNDIGDNINKNDVIPTDVIQVIYEFIAGNCGSQDTLGVLIDNPDEWCSKQSAKSELFRLSWQQMHHWMNTIHIDTNQIDAFLIPIIIQIVEIMCIVIHYILYCLIYRFDVFENDNNNNIGKTLIDINDIVLILLITVHMIYYHYYTSQAQKRIKLLRNINESNNNLNLVKYTFYMAWQNRFNNNDRNLTSNQHCWGLFWWYDRFINFKNDTKQAFIIQYFIIPSYYIMIGILLSMNIIIVTSKRAIIIIDNVLLCFVLAGYLCALLGYLVFPPPPLNTKPYMYNHKIQAISILSYCVVAIIPTISIVAFITQLPNWTNMFEMFNIEIWIVSLAIIVYVLMILIHSDLKYQWHMKETISQLNWLGYIFCGSLVITIICIILNSVVCNDHDMYIDCMISTKTMNIVSVIFIIYFPFLLILKESKRINDSKPWWSRTAQKKLQFNFKLYILGLLSHICIIFGVFDYQVLSIIAIVLYAILANIWCMLAITFFFGGGVGRDHGGKCSRIQNAVFSSLRSAINIALYVCWIATFVILLISGSRIHQYFDYNFGIIILLIHVVPIGIATLYAVCCTK